MGFIELIVLAYTAAGATVILGIAMELRRRREERPESGAAPSRQHVPPSGSRPVEGPDPSAPGEIPNHPL